MDCSPPSSSLHGIFQARILEWVAISYSRGSSRPRARTQISCISCIGGQILYRYATWEAWFGLLFIYLAAPGLSYGMQVVSLVAVCELLWACGISFPDRGSNPDPPHWELRVLATGTPGKS